jgi:hypothetical protein
MIQAQKHQNWSKYHLKLQKDPNISVMCTRRNLFLKFENTKIEHKAPNQAVKLFFYRFLVYLLFLMNFNFGVT